MLFNPYFTSNYEELITYYPKFYRDVLEMQAILKAEGKMLDAFMDGVSTIFDDCFIDTMDEQTLSQLEDFLNIKLYKTRTLEERRRLLKTFFVGHGKLSAEQIAQTVAAYTNSEVDVYFEPIVKTDGYEYYEAGDNRLYVNYLRGNEALFYLNDISTLLSRLIPAHIDYQSALTYRFCINTSVERKNHIKEFEFCGTKPEAATLGSSARPGTVVDTGADVTAKFVGFDYKFCGTVICNAGV
jgi:hypothetical protein